jgi:hypothetical protein
MIMCVGSFLVLDLPRAWAIWIKSLVGNLGSWVSLKQIAVCRKTKSVDLWKYKVLWRLKEEFGKGVVVWVGDGYEGHYIRGFGVVSGEGLKWCII